METTVTRINVDDKKLLKEMCNKTGIKSSAGLIRIALRQFKNSKNYAMLVLNLK